MSDTRIMIGTKKTPVLMSYAHVFTPKAIGDSADAKYSVSLLISKDDTAMIKKVKAAIKAAIAQGKSEKWGGKIPKNYHYPLGDGDEDKDDDEVYAGHYFVNATSKTKPGIVDEDREDIIDADEFYSGCFGRATVNFYPFKVNGKSGVACGLNNLQKLMDGDPLGGGRSSAADDFDDDNDDGGQSDFDDDDDDDLDGLM